MQPQPSSAAPSRYDGLDAVRAGAMLLGVVYHAAWAWVPDVGPWYFVADGASHPAFDVLAKVLHGFRMQVFFALSGFFAHLVVERRGVDGFLSDRFRRLMVPFLVGAPLVVGLDWALRQWSLAQGTLHPRYEGGAELLFRPLHLWFLEYLFLYCVAAWLLLKLGARAHGVTRALASAWRVPEALLGLSLITFAGLFLLGEPNPAFTFLPQLSAHAHYAPFFVLGWFLWSTRHHLEPLKRRGWWMAAAALALAPWLYSGPLQWKPWGLFLSALVAWLATLGLLGLAFRLPTAPRPFLAAAVESSYWVYLVHHPLVVAGHLLLSKVAWPAGVEYALLVGVVGLLSFGSFRLLVRRSPLAPWLGVRAAPARVMAPP